MKDVFKERGDDYETEVSKGPDQARKVYRELAFLLRIGQELSPDARLFLAERLWCVTDMDDCAEALGLKRPRARPKMTVDDRNRYLIELAVLQDQRKLSQHQASQVMASFYEKESGDVFSRLARKFPDTFSLVLHQLSKGYVLEWSKLPDGLVNLIPYICPNTKS